ncbi:uncharacterized protein LOC131218771 [Magnolia sinica]|uniref:uncharacterized protein LOC131218771 n=1 Tax=Magnolia sinica TaxID=86752 RepID=UPI0026592542|nr:uncharacterized protein LOC131218771 [Magnolia sinica]
MALTAPPLLSQVLLPKPLKSPKYPSLAIPPPLSARRTKTHLCCSSSRNPISDPELASELAAEVARINTPLVQRKEAMEKSRDLLFVDFCHYLGLKADDVKKRWRDFGEEEKLDWVRGFVAEWGVAFHPLSLKSVKEMVEECIGEGNPTPVSPFDGFARLAKVMRLY